MKRSFSIGVCGIGWVSAGESGCVLCRERGGGAGTLWKSGGAFGGPVRNAGRFDEATRLTMAATALALTDAQRGGHGLPDRATGLLGVSRSGSGASNARYFRDYLTAGRTLARGNLFIYTLPSSPLAETAIHFGFEGPLFYAGFPGADTAPLFDTADTMMADGVPEVVAVRCMESEAIAYRICRMSAASGPVLMPADILAAETPEADIAEHVRRMTQSMKGGGT